MACVWSNVSTKTTYHTSTNKKEEKDCIVWIWCFLKEKVKNKKQKLNGVVTLVDTMHCHCPNYIRTITDVNGKSDIELLHIFMNNSNGISLVVLFVTVTINVMILCILNNQMVS